MCLSTPKVSTASTEAITEQLNKSNAVLSNEKTASTTADKTGTKRTVSSLRVPLKNTTDTSTTGVNTSDTSIGLNIPI